MTNTISNIWKSGLSSARSLYGFIFAKPFGFRKTYSTQQGGLFKLSHSWQKVLDTSEFISAILMDLSETHDCLPHVLVIAQFESDGVSRISLKLLLDYLKL